MAKKKATLLKGLKVHEVSFVTKGANGEEFAIIKSDTSSDPVEILKSYMKNPETMDDDDKAMKEELGSDEAYSEYVDEFVDGFVADLEEQGEDVNKFIGEIIDARNSGNDDSEEDDSEDEEDEDDEQGSEDSEETPENEDKPVHKSLISKASELIKKAFGADKEEGDFDMKPEQIADIVAKALSPVVDSVTAVSERINGIEKKLNNEDVEKGAKKKNCQDCDPDMDDDSEENDTDNDGEKKKVKKSDDEGANEAQIIADSISKALEPITKSVSALSEKVQAIEKQGNPSARILADQNDIKKSADGDKKWTSFSINQ